MDNIKPEFIKLDKPKLSEEKQIFLEIKGLYTKYKILMIIMYLMAIVLILIVFKLYEIFKIIN